MEDSKRALEIIAALEWEQWLYDERLPRSWSLSQIINRLAFEGLPSPAILLLELLANGDLSSWAEFQWRAYADDGHFFEEGPGRISATRWADLRTHLIAGRFTTSKRINLEILELEDLQIGRYEWPKDQIGYATCSGSLFEEGYREEWFSAWDICIEQPEQGQTVTPADKAKGGRTPEYDWERAIAAVALLWGDTNWQPALQADVESKLLDWFSNQGKEPALSSVRPRAKKLFEEMQKLRDGGQ
ncbi:hypothetical protein OIK40_05960 [Erythrobacter sp. sf7]|uniref:Uncharacterized protein n=1 Tax=Erythrobacter fulvus TaxID=2987523 RepID=A0ABT5JNI8_9SPHN|nr:hypothetical protein [Erythrobacter fulvus]MDC8754188.1 hypothetical protein [Erythrobacter fulvus]